MILLAQLQSRIQAILSSASHPNPHATLTYVDHENEPDIDSGDGVNHSTKMLARSQLLLTLNHLSVAANGIVDHTLKVATSSRTCLPHTHHLKNQQK